MVCHGVLLVSGKLLLVWVGENWGFEPLILVFRLTFPVVNPGKVTYLKQSLGQGRLNHSAKAGLQMTPAHRGIPDSPHKTSRDKQ